MQREANKMLRLFFLNTGTSAHMLMRNSVVKDIDGWKTTTGKICTVRHKNLGLLTLEQLRQDQSVIFKKKSFSHSFPSPLSFFLGPSLCKFITLVIPRFKPGQSYFFSLSFSSFLPPPFFPLSLLLLFFHPSYFDL